MSLLTTALAERVSAANMDGRAGAQVWQGKVDSSIAAECRAKQREQGLVLIDGQKLPVAERPALRRKNERHDPDFR
jgi:hypothetical protein